ncbi:MAG: iron-containing redox enzyme family protein [Nitrospira sp.]|nr:iron-containing redox enzyme family protein [Nitrospira sp.]
MNKLSTDRFRKRLLSLMDDKHHWAWPHFTGSRVTKDQLQIHFRQEYAVYVRDFPVLLARIHGANPPQDVRRVLAENIYEEDTGKLSLGRPHPELFLAMMKGLGYDEKEFHEVTLLPAGKAYRRWLDRITWEQDWLVGAAVLTIFVEGSLNDRREILHPSAPKTPAEIEAHILKHPLVRHQGLPPTCMDLVRAHQLVEAGHRHDAYNLVCAHAVTAAQQMAVLGGLTQALKLWRAYRDNVATACGLKPPRS